MENEIKNMLDQLDEYHAQRDLLTVRKRELLEEVKTPAEVNAAMEEGQRRKIAAQREIQRRLDALKDETNAALAAVQIPEEVRELLKDLDAKREEIRNHQAERAAAIQSEGQEEYNKIGDEVQAAVGKVFSDLDQRRHEIEAEFMGKESDVNRNIAALEGEIRKAARDYGKTVKGKHFSAVYVKGRVTWNTDMLDGMVALVPQLAQARKEGEPSITIRKS